MNAVSGPQRTRDVSFRSPNLVASPKTRSDLLHRGSLLTPPSRIRCNGGIRRNKMNIITARRCDGKKRGFDNDDSHEIMKDNESSVIGQTNFGAPFGAVKVVFRATKTNPGAQAHFILIHSTANTL